MPLSTEASVDRFKEIAYDCGQPVRASLALMLAWLASSDGEVDPRERAFLAEGFSGLCSSSQIESLFQLGDQADLDTLLVASEVLCLGLTPEGKHLMLALAIGMMLADGVVKFYELIIVNYLGELLGFSPLEVRGIFEEITGRRMPSPGDPGSRGFWEKEPKKKKSHSRVTSRAEALGVLGLEGNASHADIKSAYRRLAKANHPDRFQSLGPEAVEIATRAFTRIQQAYDFLGRP